LRLEAFSLLSTVPFNCKGPIARPYVEPGQLGTTPPLNSGDTPMIRLNLLIATLSVILANFPELADLQAGAPGR
jgi:hypothetical protein